VHLLAAAFTCVRAIPARRYWACAPSASPAILPREYNHQFDPITPNHPTAPKAGALEIAIPRVVGTARDTEGLMTQKVIDVVGISKESFAKAAEAAVKEAAKTVRGIKWAHVDSLDMQLDGAKVLQYRATTKIYFDVEG